MDKKIIIKYLLIIIISIFLFLYFFGSNIFQSKLTEKRILTQKQIEKFEEDVKNNVEIDINNYVVKDKSYNNFITDTNRKISNAIELGFKKIFEYILKNVDI